jgi:hypothetical protein
VRIKLAVRVEDLLRAAAIEGCWRLIRAFNLNFAFDGGLSLRVIITTDSN